MTVRDIPDVQRGGQDLGSVVFSESFLESSINVQQKGKILIRLRPILRRSASGLIRPVCAASHRWQRVPGRLLHHPDRHRAPLRLLAGKPPLQTHFPWLIHTLKWGIFF